MGISDIASLPIRLGAAVRDRRLFHPAGVLAQGALERTAPPDDGLPMVSSHLIGRVSKGIGLPDVAGLAWRLPPQLRTGTPWDLLLASARGRLVPRPVGSWAGATFSSLMAWRYRGGIWWLRARLVTNVESPGLSLDGISQQIAATGIDFDVEQAEGWGDFRPLARLTLSHVDPSSDDIAFDPTLHTDPTVHLVPDWLGEYRRASYRRSRQGHDDNA